MFASVPLDNLRMSIKGTFDSIPDGKQKERFYQYRFTQANGQNRFKKRILVENKTSSQETGCFTKFTSRFACLTSG